jgi:ABC-type tungstate transport system permease subunit|tara:strand:- start:4733 stop:5173 length:441 start_codon:yes stop_codon:yes gene_type:complete
MSYTKYRQEREALENAYARRLLIEYGIREVTTQRQAKNGTREFEFPVSTYANTNEYYKKWLKSQGRSLKDTPRLRIACFKSGYVRKQNGTYSPYQLNKTYNQNSRQMFLIDGKLEIRKYIGKARTLIWSQLARMNYMLEYYLKNYK